MSAKFITRYRLKILVIVILALLIIGVSFYLIFRRTVNNSLVILPDKSDAGLPKIVMNKTTWQSEEDIKIKLIKSNDYKLVGLEMLLIGSPSWRALFSDRGWLNLSTGSFFCQDADCRFSCFKDSIPRFYDQNSETDLILPSRLISCAGDSAVEEALQPGTYQFNLTLWNKDERLKSQKITVTSPEFVIKNSLNASK
ncbi:MAG: hypothetical protein A2445_00835 [Candidatus Jacksonbacteria bacterium RIFOXYC2_FULL_44_29]|nr:MAG: hypothetical protein UV19_C0004G0010 [Parcubacteria group bacterium GW2011_GWA2_42_28]KKT55445.1 MAG: hypothetical protein UW45_C0007G0010 [Parcubacteria group bacterium GW2011_GWC2_44_22]OGY75244.1 MAG: hypothetical protein A2240_05930 [Candidatus Jacksonbacteria bacterium RIFOXYA2_FULL_43_12]OGY75947.1 MAG: hypothetical protein A2295_03435 [Candidatus Jacksonbacteria bacterium RIFOXYB2_FULL_44_15]OGY77962.1 MAG: hypothetical protein A2445_00835 [Candidatus Jacksonbacteria bacterium RI